jgi:hypothetical protein
MKTYFKFFITLIIILSIFSCSFVYAIDMFLSNFVQNSDTTQIENILSNEEKETLSQGTFSSELPESTTTTGEVITNPAPTVTRTSSSSNTTLSISDIIDIILIAVCVVLIFLGIAILIRCK